MIETERLTLRLPRACDAAAIALAMADPEVMRYIGSGETGTFDDAARAVERMLHAWEEDGFGRFIVVRREIGAAIGRVGLLAWHPEEWRSGTRRELGDDAEIELGWTLHRTAWGHGFATEAAAAVCDWALREVRPRRLISLIQRENARSIRVAEKIGERYQQDVVTCDGMTVQLWAL